MVLAETQQTKFNWPFSPIRDETQMTPYEIFDLDPKEWNQERSQKYLRGTILRIYDAFKVSHEKLSAFMRRETIEAEFHISLFDSPQLRDIRREDVRRIVLGAVNGAMVLMERALKWVEDASFNQWHDPADGTKKCWIVLPGERDILYRFYTRKLGRKLVHWPRPGNKCAYVTVNPVNLGASAKETGVPKEDSWPFDDPSGTTKMSAYDLFGVNSKDWLGKHTTKEFVNKHNKEVNDTIRNLHPDQLSDNKLPGKLHKLGFSQDEINLVQADETIKQTVRKTIESTGVAYIEAWSKLKDGIDISTRTWELLAGQRAVLSRLYQKRNQNVSFWPSPDKPPVNKTSTTHEYTQKQGAQKTAPPPAPRPPRPLPDLTEQRRARGDALLKMFANIVPPPEANRARNSIYHLQVTLKILAIGASIPLNIQRPVPCAQCTLLEQREYCGTCNAKGWVTNVDQVLVKIEPGMSHCDEIVILDKGMHEEGKAKPGHLVVVLDQLKDPQYERKGADLIVEKTVPLKEALLGFTEEYVLPTGNVVPITLAPGEIMRHKDKRLCVPGLGMPTRISALRRGNLVFDFTIEYPNAEWITKHEGFIARSLPPKVDTPKATIKASRGQTRLSPHFLVPCKEDVVPEEGPGCAVQ